MRHPARRTSRDRLLLWLLQASPLSWFPQDRRPAGTGVSRHQVIMQRQRRSGPGDGPHVGGGDTEAQGDLALRSLCSLALRPFSRWPGLLSDQWSSRQPSPCPTPAGRRKTGAGAQGEKGSRCEEPGACSLALESGDTSVRAAPSEGGPNHRPVSGPGASADKGRLQELLLFIQTPTIQ